MGSGLSGGLQNLLCIQHCTFSQTNHHKKRLPFLLSLSLIFLRKILSFSITLCPFPKKVKNPWFPYKRCYGKGLRSRTKRVDQGLEWVTHAMLLVISFMFLGAMMLIGTSPIMYSSLILVGLFVIFLQNSCSCLALLV